MKHLRLAIYDWRLLSLALACAFFILPSAFPQSTLTADGLAAYIAPATGGGGGDGDTQWLSASGFGTTRNNFNGEVGCKFTVNSAVTLTSLGGWVISGSTQTHRIAIWDSTDQVNAIATVSLNKSGLSVGFNYVSVSTPTNLLSGHTYYMGEEEFSGGDAFYNDDQQTDTTTGVATIVNSSFHSGTFSCPNSAGSTGVKCFGPVNFLYH